MKRFWLQSLAITTFVFGMLWVADELSDKKVFTAFDTIGQAMKDFELTDYAFSNLRPEPTVDERIVLVNIGTFGRREMAQQIAILNSFNPRVIAYDGFFNCEGGLYDTLNCPQLLDTLGNLILADAIQQANNFVLGSKLIQTDSVAQYDVEYYDSLEISDSMFDRNAKYGFISLPTDAAYQEDVKICRSLFPSWVVNGQRELAWSVQIAMQYDSAKTNKFLARGNKEELINFRGNIEVRTFKVVTEKIDETSTSNFKTMYYAVDADQLLRGDVLPEMFKDKIVLMGYLGDYLGHPAWEDRFFTPLNNKVAGRANPDMFGLVVHANVISMILNEDYIDEIPEWLKYAVAVFVCVFTVALFILIDDKLPLWFDALSVIIQLVEISCISLFVIYAFTWWNLKLDLTIAIGVSALVGPCYDFFRSIQNEINKRLTKRRAAVLNAET